jgi:hypothetical protein
MSEEICTVCGKPVLTGQDRHIDESGRHYHLSCWRTLPPTKPMDLSDLATQAVEMIVERLITQEVISAVKARFSSTMEKYKISEDELIAAIKERLVRR